jgi:hypothetical protein
MSQKEGDLIVGFLKVRNEIIREGNIYRCLHNMSEICDEIYAVDDASYDGTYEYLKSFLPEDHIIRVKPEDQDFSQELKVKQELLELIHSNGPWKYILWQDADEVLSSHAVAGLRDFCRAHLGAHSEAYSFHYLQLWRNSSWYRLDDGFNDGYFIKLWKYRPDLVFELIHGTHHPQFPLQVAQAFNSGRVEKTPFECIHYGNYGTNLRWKCIQYHGGLGGVDRHLRFQKATYQEIDKNEFPSGAEHASELEPKPEPFTDEEIKKTLQLENLKELPETFCITISTRNRAYSLPRAIDSVLKQSYEKWILVVVDDGSTDDTPAVMRRYQDLDPRIFYVRCLLQRGGVAVNEIACDIAMATAEYWVRLGSDDWFLGDKLLMDFDTLKEHDAVYGPFIDHHQGTFEAVGNYPVPAKVMKGIFEQGGFFASWANFAVKTKILRQLKEKYGNVCDPRLINMEDCLQNYRICKETPWIWRGMFHDEVIINPSDEKIKQIMQDTKGVMPDAVWNKNPDGASANMTVYAKDRDLTSKIINAEKSL